MSTAGVASRTWTLTVQEMLHGGGEGIVKSPCQHYMLRACFVQAMMQNWIEANPPVIHILKTKKKKSPKVQKWNLWHSRTTTPHTNTRKNLTANCTQKSISIHHPQANKLVSPEHNRYHIPPPLMGATAISAFFLLFFCLSRVRWGSTRLPIPYHTYTADRFSKKKKEKRKEKEKAHNDPETPCLFESFFLLFFFFSFLLSRVS